MAVKCRGMSLPLLIVIDVFAIKYLVKPEKYIISGEYGAATDTDKRCN